jgi:hypothetical protein
MRVAIFRKGRQVQEIRHDEGPVAVDVRRDAESAELTPQDNRYLSDDSTGKK